MKDLSTVYKQTVPGHYETDEYVFFWSGPFSNWHPSTFTMPCGGFATRFSCAEQAMMLIKANTFGDSEIAKKIMATKDPKEQKALGRKVKGFDPVVWDSVKMDEAHEFLLRKFYQNPELRDILENTGDKIIVEASPYDTVWGIGMGVDKYPQILNPDNWKGENLLGIALMKVREELRTYGDIHPELEIEHIFSTEIIAELDNKIIDDILKAVKDYDSQPK